MKKVHISIFLVAAALSVSFLNLSKNNTKAPVVTIKKTGETYSLFRNGQPYFIKGAGGYDHFDRLKECGGNSVRLWSTYNAKEYLDKAHALGLTVTLGLDMAHERKGFNYDNKKAVQEQLEKLKKEVLLYKDHPALLMWGVGNEVDQFAKNYNVWNAVNDLAKFIHEADPNHPTTTMLAGVPKKH
ncbi:MAG: glycoside hydrolase family 2 TIM barrel-domain containing protein, partial [Kaistella sp.]